MKTNKLMIKLSLVLLLSGFFGVGMKINTVHADDWGLDVGYGLNKGLNDQSDQTNKQHSVHDSDFDTPYGYHLFGPISDVPLFTPGQLKLDNSINNIKRITGKEKHEMDKADNYRHPVKIRGYRVTKLVKKYYNSCSTKFAKFNKLRGLYGESDIDLVHHNGLFLCDNLAPDGRQYNYNNDNDPEDYLDGGEYVLGYKKINGLWMELRAWKFPRENVFVHPSFSAVGPMPSKAVYKCIKTTNTYGAPDDGTANGFGDKDHQYAQVCSATVKGTRIHINDDKSNWRANYNVQKVYGGQQRESVALTNSDALKGAGGHISLINFNKYFKRIK
ncbi:hypothetical protein [Lactobacillus crispatus]|uniref:hypothetical protein n=1 Tax=Lactobacillus crispatus TaxID=47770 RepID=UPI00123B8901|nr:hypothetical protein [Lactobacillus crispatus]KAA8780526.1 hypothetical protein F1C01_00835 [Lactobacillus crispatus]KAA8792088.1 hypothetical protein F1C00_10670 [Lactobacillus crispatus]KAA8807050.1 hypothetical protein F1C06_10615 [Lactobacillus crispatus]